MISKIFNPDIERGVILSRGSVFKPDLDQIQYPGTRLRNNGQTLDDATRNHILQTLDEVRWVIGGRHGSATRLGVPRTTLISKMRRLGIGAARAECAAWGATIPEAFATAASQ